MLVFQTWAVVEWSDQTRFIHEYDSEGREISYMIQFHDSEGWYDYMKDEYFYEDNKLVKYVLWYGGENREPLAVDSETLRFYNEHELLERKEIYRWDNNEKILYEEEYNYYDDKLREIERVTKRFDFVSNDLINNFRQTKSYEGNISEPSVITDHKWANDDWVGIQRSAYLYDDNELWIEHTLQTWADEWINVSKMVKERNQKDQETARINMIWADEQEWVNYTQTLIDYNNDDKVIRSLDQNFRANEWVNYVEYSYYYEMDRRYLTLKRLWTEDQWLNETRTYLDGWLGVDDLAFTDLRLKVFPNPASNTLTISLFNEEHSFIDARIISFEGNEGLIISNETIPAGEITFNQDISDLPSGTYLVLMNIEGKRIMQKFIINR
jgi:hypothetical protein